MPDPIQLAYFSDVLCVWAYVAQIRLDELRAQFGDQVVISYHFTPLFGCTAKRIGSGWQTRGGFEGFSRHVRDVCGQFDHVTVHPDVWQAAIPASSAATHHFLKAAQLLEVKGTLSPQPVPECQGRSTFEELVWRVRTAFFCEARNISELETLCVIAQTLDLPISAIRAHMESGEAMAALCGDHELANDYKVEGSPTYILNAGRQKLYGNVGYKIIEANVHEVLHRPSDQATWC